MAPRFSKTITLRVPTALLRTADNLARKRPAVDVGALNRGDFLANTRSDVLRFALAIGLKRLADTYLEPKSSPATKTP